MSTEPVPANVDRPQGREVRWERMFRDELEKAFQACPLTYFPYGICEPHGPGNPLGNDALNAHGVVCAAARAHGGIVAPAWFWHIAELGGDGVWCAKWIGEVERSWFTSLPPWVFFRDVCYHIRTAEAMGFKAAIMVTGHAGPFVEDWQKLVEKIQPRTGVRLQIVLTDAIQVVGFNDGKGSTHGGRRETSTLWALEPGCVDMSRLPAEVPEPKFGMGADIHQADRRVGESVVAEMADFLGAKGRELIAEFDRLQPKRNMKRYIDVERFLQAEILPNFKSFESMKNYYRDQKPISPDSVWYPNWQVPEEFT